MYVLFAYSCQRQKKKNESLIFHHVLSNIILADLLRLQRHVALVCRSSIRILSLVLVRFLSSPALIPTIFPSVPRFATSGISAFYVPLLIVNLNACTAMLSCIDLRCVRLTYCAEMWPPLYLSKKMRSRCHPATDCAKALS